LSRQLFIHAGRKPLVEQRVKSCARSLHSDWRDFVSQRMFQSGFVLLQQYFPHGLFRRIKTDPSIIISALLVLIFKNGFKLYDNRVGSHPLSFGKQGSAKKPSQGGSISTWAKNFAGL